MGAVTANLDKHIHVHPANPEKLILLANPEILIHLANPEKLIHLANSDQYVHPTNLDKYIQHIHTVMISIIQ